MRIKVGGNYTTVNLRIDKNLNPSSILCELVAGPVLEVVEDGDFYRFAAYIHKSAATRLPDSPPNIVYVSQIGAGAWTANDCGQTCCSMVTGAKFTPDQISNEFAAHQEWFDGNGPWRKGMYTTFNQHVQWLKSRGLSASKQYIKGYPPIGSIALINYSLLPDDQAYDKNFKRSSQPWHFVVFEGVSEDGCLINDPLWPGEQGKLRLWKTGIWERCFTGSAVVLN